MLINFSACWALKQTIRISHFLWSDKELKVTGGEYNNRYFPHFSVFSRQWQPRFNSPSGLYEICFLKAHQETMMDHENEPTLSFSKVYLASPPVVHYAAFCTTARLQFRLQICQPGCHGSQWSDRNVPITEDISVLFLHDRTSFSNPSQATQRGFRDECSNIFVAPQR